MAIEAAALERFYEFAEPSDHAVESVNARIRRAVKARGHVPNEQATLNALAITFEGRLIPTIR